MAIKRQTCSERSESSGFTVIEIIAVIGIIAALVGMMTPLAFQMIGARREQSTREELETIKKAIIGEARSTMTGKEFSFGFAGDIGGVPTSLDRLRTRATLPAFSFDTTKGTGAGWNGPYIMEKIAGDFKIDPYGSEYVYSTTPYTNTSLGVEVRAKVTSPGPDLATGTSDDLSVEILKPEIFSRVIGFVKDSLGSGVPSTTVTINYPSAGSLTTATALTNIDGMYEFTDIPIGDRTITVDPKLFYKSGSASTVAPAGKDLKFTIQNFSQNDIAITSLKAEYTVSPAAFYEKIVLNGVTVFTWSTTRPGSGTTVSFASAIIARSTVSKEPFLTRIQPPKVETPDIIVTRLGAGGSLDVELQGFNDAATGAANTVDMTGVPFKITFSDGSVVIFTPVKK